MTIRPSASSYYNKTQLYGDLTHPLTQLRVAQPIIDFIHKNFLNIRTQLSKINFYFSKGESGIRTHGTRKDSSDFKSDAIDQLCHLAKRLAIKLILNININ